MNNVLYLLAAAGVAAVGILVLWARSRAPRSVDSGVDGFNRQMDALSPKGPQRGHRQ